MFPANLSYQFVQRISVPIGLVVCLFATSLRAVTIGVKTPSDDKSTTRSVGAFDAVVVTGESAVVGGGAGTAAVRWLPGTTVNIGYVREDFTDSEISAFHDAIGHWQRALSHTKVNIIFTEALAAYEAVNPAPSQIIVKREKMSPNDYGRIVASARPDRYLESALVLINNSIHKRKTLRKILMHELGHALGLRDCSNCRSGATVMNHFSKRSAFGIEIQDGTVASKPTSSDISQVEFGYSQIPAKLDGEQAESKTFETITADEEGALAAGTNSANTENILAPYVGPGQEARSVPVGGLSNDRVLSNEETTAFGSYLPTLLKKEAETMDQLRNYEFKRDVLIQTIDGKGRVSGEYHRTSDMVLDDEGRRVERNVSLSKPTLRGLEVTTEYVEDFSGAQLKGFELAQRDHYRFEPFSVDTLDGQAARVYRITPLNLSVERAAQARVFYGFIWADETTGQILRIAGCALPDDKQRYPLFETKRTLIDGKYLFPERTIADDRLVFPSRTVHVRMLISYTNYKRFGSRVNIVELEAAEPDAPTEQGPAIPFAVIPRKPNSGKFYFDYFCWSCQLQY